MIDGAGEAKRWCILRMAGPRTLPVMQSLAEAGFVVWTPMATTQRRKPRSPARVAVQTAMLPTFVFAQVDRLSELSRLSRSPINPHPAFSVFRFNGKVAHVSDRDIEALRVAERQAVPKRKRRTMAKGAIVRLAEGAYAGLEGVVQDSDGRYTLVAFGGWMNVRFDTFVLTTDPV